MTRTSGQPLDGRIELGRVSRCLLHFILCEDSNICGPSRWSHDEH